MCGRIYGPGDWSELNEYFEEIFVMEAIEPSQEIFPTNQYPIIAAQDGGEVCVMRARWSLIPSFFSGAIKDWKAATFNARVEDAATKPSFRVPWRRRRCLVPVDHFYEWTGPKSARERLSIRRTDNHQLVFAGLWDKALTMDGEVVSFTIVTRPSGEDIRPFHDREPAVLEPDDWKKWLSANSVMCLEDSCRAGTLSVVASVSL